MNLRRTVQYLSTLAAFAAAITYVVAVYMSDSSPATRLVYRISAITGLVAFVIGLFLSRKDAKDSADLRDKLDREIEELSSEQLKRIELERKLSMAIAGLRAGDPVSNFIPEVDTKKLPGYVSGELGIDTHSGKLVRWDNQGGNWIVIG